MMEITFPGGVQVNAQFNGFKIATDQPEKMVGRIQHPRLSIFFSHLSVHVPDFSPCVSVSSGNYQLTVCACD